MPSLYGVVFLSAELNGPVPWLDTLRPPCKIFLAAPGFYVQFKYTLYYLKNCHHTLAAPLRPAAPRSCGGCGALNTALCITRTSWLDFGDDSAHDANNNDRNF